MHSGCECYFLLTAVLVSAPEAESNIVSTSDEVAELMERCFLRYRGCVNCLEVCTEYYSCVLKTCTEHYSLMQISMLSIGVGYDVTINIDGEKLFLELSHIPMQWAQAAI